MLVLEVLAYPFQVILRFPPLALVPAALLFLGFWRVRSKAVLRVALLWALYAIYESYMTWVWSPQVMVPIRIDVLFIGAILYIATGFGIWKIFGPQGSVRGIR
jgi:hypothetical protein